jgi:hypothetical protein
MGCHVGAEGRGKRLTEQNVAVLIPLAPVDPDLTRLQVHVGHGDVTKLADPDRREEQEPQHQSVLHVVGAVHHFVETAEVVGVQHTGQAAPPLHWSQVTLLAHLLGDVAPAIIVHARPSHNSSDLGDNFGFRFLILRRAIGVVLVHSLSPSLSKPAVHFVVQALCEIVGGPFAPNCT